VLKVNRGDYEREEKQMSNRAERRRNHFIIAAIVAGAVVYVLLGQNVAYAALAALVGGFLAQAFWD
jgi:hypothetical protein